MWVGRYAHIHIHNQIRIYMCRETGRRGRFPHSDRRPAPVERLPAVLSAASANLKSRSLTPVLLNRSLKPRRRRRRRAAAACCRMDSTLSVLDEAYDSGRRSRTSSFHSQRPDGALYDVGETDAQAQPQSQQLQANHLQLDPAAIYRSSHRRQASDTSELDPLSATSSPYPPAAAILHQNVRPVYNISPVTLDLGSPDPVCGPVDDPGLREAFDASLFMGERQQDNLAPQNLSTALFASQEQYISPMDQAYQNMLRRSHSGQSTFPYPVGRNTMRSDSSLNLADGGHATVPSMASHSSSRISSPFDGLAAYDERSMNQNIDVSQATDFSSLSPFETLNVNQSALNASHNAPPSFAMGPGSHGEEVQFDLTQSLPGYQNSQNLRGDGSLSQVNYSQRQDLLGPDQFSQATLEVPSPYSDAGSFERSSMGEHGSPSIDPLALSRTTSFNSQFQPQSQYDQLQVSAPGSPYGPETYNSPIEARMPAFDGLDTFDGQAMFQAQDQYAFLRPLPGPQPLFYRPGQTPMATTQVNTNYNEFGAPGIAIDPPTPAQSYLLSRHAPTSYPFPQQVPTITTTAVSDRPTGRGGQMLGADLGIERVRGRSNSDSNLELHPSYTRSGQNLSSDTTPRSRSPGANVLGIDRRSSSHNRVSKPADHLRRASWSGVPDHMEEDLADGRDGQQTNSRQKNPATFICPVDGCNKAFTRAYNLRSHQRTHTNERPFLCEICGKGFARQHDRKRHEKLHTNEKPFSCPGCQKKFARMDALSRHFKSETGKDCIINNPEYQHFLDDMDE